MNSTMETIILLGIMCLVMGAGMYLLYLNGWMVVNAKSAAAYVGSKRGTSASFSHCSGYVRRIVRFREDRVYTFTLDSALTKGEMTVSLLGPDKKELLRLSSDQPCMAAELERKKRYTLILHFHCATGRYGLRWD